MDEVEKSQKDIKVKEKLNWFFICRLKGDIFLFLKDLKDYDKENFSIVLISNQEFDDKTFEEFSKK